MNYLGINDSKIDTIKLSTRYDIELYEEITS